MLIILGHRKWKRTFAEITENCIVHHVLGDWYIVRDMLKNGKGKWYKRFVWFTINKNDFLKAGENDA